MWQTKISFEKIEFLKSINNVFKVMWLYLTANLYLILCSSSHSTGFFFDGIFFFLVTFQSNRNSGSEEKKTKPFTLLCRYCWYWRLVSHCQCYNNRSFHLEIIQIAFDKCTRRIFSKNKRHVSGTQGMLLYVRVWGCAWGKLTTELVKLNVIEVGKKN